MRCDEIENCGLSRAGRSDQRGHLSRPNPERQVPQYRVIVELKINILENDV